MKSKREVLNENKIKELEKENKILEQQISKTKSCENCKHFIKKCEVKICTDYDK